MPIVPPSDFTDNPSNYLTARSQGSKIATEHDLKHQNYPLYTSNDQHLRKDAYTFCGAGARQQTSGIKSTTIVLNKSPSKRRSPARNGHGKRKLKSARSPSAASTKKLTASGFSASKVTKSSNKMFKREELDLSHPVIMPSRKHGKSLHAKGLSFNSRMTVN